MESEDIGTNAAFALPKELVVLLAGHGACLGSQMCDQVPHSDCQVNNKSADMAQTACSCNSPGTSVVWGVFDVRSVYSCLF